MNNLTLGDLVLILSDLLENRRAVLESTAIGKSYLVLFGELHGKIQGLPQALLEGTPLAVALKETDRCFDGLGRAIWYYTVAIAEHPLVDAEVKAAAGRVQAAFVPSLSVLRETYPDEAAHTQDRQKALPGLTADLQRLAVPGGGTLEGWVTAYLGKGVELNRLLTDRADARADVAGDPERRKAVPALRTSAIGLIGRLRAGLADELRANAALPRDLDARIFSYLDGIVKTRA